MKAGVPYRRGKPAFLLSLDKMTASNDGFMTGTRSKGNITDQVR
ncbi:hypothetical protein [Paenibacillus terrigena]|nr:hypothetical protein [Paenibacillus terrigena]